MNLQEAWGWKEGGMVAILRSGPRHDSTRLDTTRTQNDNPTWDSHPEKDVERG